MLRGITFEDEPFLRMHAGLLSSQGNLHTSASAYPTQVGVYTARAVHTKKD
jgi:hypothetical protein